MVEYLLQGSRAHHERFAHVQAKIRFTHRAKASSLEDAMLGHWLPDPEPVVCSVFWACAGGRCRYDRVYTPETIAKYERRQGVLTVREISSQYAVWNDFIEIECEPGQRFNVARRGDLVAAGGNPFNVGMSAPVYKRADVIRQRFKGSVTYEGEKELGGRRLPVLLFKQEFGGEYGRPQLQLDLYWLDPERGFNPVRVETYFDTLDRVAQVLSVQEIADVGGGRWLPTLARYAGIAELVYGYEAKVEGFEVDSPMPDELFAIPVSAGGYNRITNEVLSAPAGRVGLADFRDDGSPIPHRDRILVRQKVLTSESGGIHPDDPSGAQWPFQRARQASPWWWGLAGIVCLIAAVIMWIRRERRTLP